MAAGLGFKDFVTGEVLTAADVDGYLMQGIWVFASTAARDAAVTSPQEGNFAFTKDTNGLWYYDGAAWVASGATGDIEGVTAGIGISGGGTSGTVTVTNSMATAIDAKGDLVAGTGADTFAKLTVGANDTVLTADSTAATGLKWATPSGGGSNWILLNSGGTTLAGTTGVTVSGISGKDKIMVILTGITCTTPGITFGLRFNSDAGNNYNIYGMHNNGETNQSNITEVNVVYVQGGQSGTCATTISGCNSSGVKAFMSVSGVSNGIGGYDIQGYWNNSATVTSVTARCSGFTFGAGTIFVYTSTD